MSTNLKKSVYHPLFKGRFNRNMAMGRLNSEIKKILRQFHFQWDKRAAFQRLLMHAQGNSDLLRSSVFGYDRSREAKIYIKALATLALYYDDFIRPIEDWEGGTDSPRELFHSLFQHLLAKYQTPRFMDSVWFTEVSEENDKHRRQHIEMARGKSFRRMNPPIEMTRRMEHFFLKAPGHFSYTGALRFAQLKAMGAEDWLLKEVLNSRLGAKLENESFWEGLLSFLISYQEKGLDPWEVAPIINFLHNVKFHRLKTRSVMGEVTFQPPRLPDFSLKEHTLNSLMELVEGWDGQIQGRQIGGYRYWRKSSFQGFDFTEESKNPEKPLRLWNISELLDSAELIREGRNMRHCVGLYIQKCFTRKTTIWSMARLQEDKRIRVLTVQVNPKTSQMLQIQGRGNRRPKERELDILRQWARRENLIM